MTILIMILLPHSQLKWLNMKDWHLLPVQVLRKTAGDISKLHDIFQRLGEKYIKSCSRGHVNVSVSFPEMSHASFVTEMQKLQFLLTISQYIKKFSYISRLSHCKIFFDYNNITCITTRWHFYVFILNFIVHFFLLLSFNVFYFWPQNLKTIFFPLYCRFSAGQTKMVSKQSVRLIGVYS